MASNNNEALNVESMNSGSRVKRKGSWKKFKDWISGSSKEPQPEPEKGVPSAVFPSDDVTKATTDVKNVLHNTNCYSGRGPPTTHRKSPNRERASIDIPRIVVTSDAEKSPQRPPRRTSEYHIRNSVSSPDIANEDDPAQSFSFPSSGPAIPDIQFQTPGGTRRRSEQPLASSDSRLDDAPHFDKDDATEIKKQLAVMKIRQAMSSLDDTSLLKRPMLTDRRFSDVSGLSSSRETSPIRRSQSQRGPRPRLQGQPGHSLRSALPSLC